MTQEYNCIHQSTSSTFFRNTLIKEKHFKEGVFTGEDTIFVNNFLLIKPIMGLIREALYFYRKRADSSSTVQNQKINKNFYLETLNDVENYLVNSSRILYNKIVPFVQFFIGYDILFRIKSNAFKIIDSQNLKDYSNMIEKLLKQIDDKYILEQNNVPNNYKMFALSKKYQRDLRYDIQINNNTLVYSDHILLDLNKEKNIIVWRILDVNNNMIHLEEKDNFWMPRDKYFYYCRFENDIFFPKYSEYSNYDFETTFGIMQKGRIVIFDIPLNKIKNYGIINFYITYFDYTTEIFTSLGWFSHLPSITNGYYHSGNYIIKYIDNRLYIFHYSQKREIYFENLYCLELKKYKKDYLIKLRKRIIEYRKKKRNFIQKNEIWLINDRHNQAGDNGEYFFRYLKLKNPEGIKFYFALEKNCSDPKRLKKFDNLIDLNSKKYINIFIIADKIISSISNSWVTNPFNLDYNYIKDLLEFDNIFLQHGIIKDDLSKYLNRFNKKYDLFVTSTKKEYLSLLSPKYRYSKNNIILTGLPRYDNLDKLKNKMKKENIILVIPTWRANIKGTLDLITYESIHSEAFIFTDFFKFYNNLINDKNLHLYMSKNNYTGILCLHPCFSSQWIDFNQNKYFSVFEKCDYQKLLLNAAILITDYSSIFFDFGYLRKPIIFTHFDYDEYRANHYQQGYFNYEKDGFGPVCKDINCTVKEIIYEIENNGILRKKYLRRIRKIFTFSDGNNCKRIYEKIKGITNHENIESNYYFIYKYFILISLAIIIYKANNLYSNIDEFNLKKYMFF